jgi:hypothetical protein
MKIDVSNDALLQALVEAIRGERDHGAALMSLVSRLINEACQQDWFQAHWRTDARLRLARIACGHMPKEWRSAVPVLEVIAESARLVLRADDVDSESRALLLAIMRLADVERSARPVAEPEPLPVAKYTARRKANGGGAVRRGRTAARPGKPAALSQALAGHKTRPADVKIAAARKAKRTKAAGRSRTPAQLAKAATSPQGMVKARLADAKATAARKAKRTKPGGRSRTPAQLAEAAASPQGMAKVWPADVKAAAGRKAKHTKAAGRSRTPAQLAKAAASPQGMAKVQPADVRIAAGHKAKRTKPAGRSRTPAQLAKAAASPQEMVKVRPADAKISAARKPNGAGQASTKVGAPVIST